MTLDVKAHLRKLAQAAVNADNASREPGAHSFAMRAADEAEYEFRNAITPAHYLALLDRLERAEARVALARVHLDALADFDDVRDWDTSQPDYIEREAAYDAAHTSLRAALDDEAPR